jgi:MraZ protein
MAKRFAGTHSHKVEPRGRVSLPADFRKVLKETGSESIYIVPQFRRSTAHACFTESGFERLCDDFDQKDMTPEEQEVFEEFVIARAKPVDVDEMGRIVIPADLRSMIGLEGELVFVGLGSFFELRGPEAHAAKSDGIVERGQAIIGSLRIRGPA